LADHHEVTAVLEGALGDNDFTPARRAQIAWQRASK